jgi:hypothetical protein
LSGFYSHKGFPVPLRRIKYIDPKTHKRRKRAAQAHG